MVGNLDQAFDKIQQAHNLDPGFPISWKLAYISALKEDYLEAMPWLDQGIQHAASPAWRADALWIRAYFYYWLGNSKKAFEDLDLAHKEAEAAGHSVLKRMPIWLKAWIMFDKGDIEGAINAWTEWSERFRQAESESPSFKFRLSFYLGLAALRKGQKREAEACLAAMRSLLAEIEKPLTGPSPHPAYCDILEGEMLIAAGKAQNAIRICEKTTPWICPELGAITPTLRGILLFHS